MNKGKLTELAVIELSTGNWLPLKDAAKMLKVTLQTIRNYCDGGKMEARKFYGKIMVKCDAETLAKVKEMLK